MREFSVELCYMRTTKEENEALNLFQIKFLDLLI